MKRKQAKPKPRRKKPNPILTWVEHIGRAQGIHAASATDAAKKAAERSEALARDIKAETLRAMESCTSAIGANARHGLAENAQRIAELGNRLAARIESLEKSSAALRSRLDELLGPEPMSAEDRTALGQWAKARRLRIEQAQKGEAPRDVEPQTMLGRIRKWLCGTT